MPRSRGTRAALVLAAVWLAAAPAEAGDVSGNARIYGATTDSDGEDENVLSQIYHFRFMQPITPWLRFHAGFQADDFDVSPDGGPEFERRSNEPSFELSYARDRIYGLIGYRDRRTRGSNEADTLDAVARYGQFSFRPARGPQYSLRLDSSSNVADVAVFGRDLDTRSVNFDVSQVARTWTARYAFRDFDLDNNMTGFELGQREHLVQGTFDDLYFEDRLRFSTDVLLRRTDQLERTPAGQTIAEPLFAREGLGDVDPTPEIGTLPDVPTLIDGDLVSPAVPRLEIGGANTFRNAGLDLGFTRQVTRLEVTVDALSDPSLLWAVYHGPDNLTWTAIGGVISTFDVAFLRYTLRFPETTDRYFKAVNLSVNVRTGVAITEVRALIDTTRTGTERRRSTTERIFLRGDLRPNEIYRGSLTVGFNSDGGSGGGLPVRDVRETTYEALFGAAVGRDKDLRFRYHRSDFRREELPVLRRDETRYDAAFSWTPLPTVDTLVSVARREEVERNRLIRQTDSVRATALTDLLPGLRLTSEISYSDVNDPFSGFTLATWTWKETFETRPADFVTFAGGFSFQRFDARGRISLERRTSAHGRVRLALFPELSLGMDLNYGSEDGRRTLTQRYDLNWTPGPRLTASAAYAETDSLGEVTTSNASATVDYRLSHHLGLFAIFARSELDQAFAAATRVTTLQFGMTLAF